MAFQNTFNLLIFCWIIIALILFPILLNVRAPYGRHARKGWGLMINNRLGWFLMELPALSMFLYFTLSYGNFSNLFVVTASLLWVAHYFHRVIIFPLRIHTKGKKMPVLIIASAFFFNMVNGTINGYQIGNYDLPFKTDGFNLFLYFLGVGLFIFGYIINQYHDKILIGLRKNNNGYQIPYGGWFRFVSCPNFLGEIIEWAGFFILCHNLASLAFFIWTVVNLVPRAINHHKWYKETFPEYPKERKAVFPGIV
jgi:3-oxo-5-alpha-steroid 4-dehydrogenase 1